MSIANKEKEELRLNLISTLEVKLDKCNSELKEINQIKKLDSKSSAGDKFETSVEMTQQEVNKHSILRESLENQLDVLKKLADRKVEDKVSVGSLVVTNNGKFYISVGIGVVKADTGTYFVISRESPLGSELMGKSSGDKLNFNGRDYKITELG
ncbi:MAG: transcription elongation GreA/GreB family factor [Sphingobacteriales bacterium]|jgi:transcription elongation GreA/GreB family factor